MTTFSPEQISKLQAKLDGSAVKEREQSGRKLSYIEGWHAVAEANRIFGFDAWNRETLDIRCVAEGPRKIGRQNPRDGFGVSYIARVRITIGEIVREGIGSGHGIDVDLGLAHESAIKEAETDAMKRALMTFGNPFGLALYDKTQANVEHDEPRTTDQRSEQGRREVQRQEQSKPVSTVRMKEGLKAIDDDLLDCLTILDVDKCAKIWAAIMDRDGWSKDYREVAIPKFQARRDALAVDPSTLPPHLANIPQRPL